MKAIIRFAFLLIISVMVIAQPALPFEYPLSDTAIREAFLTGNANNNRTTKLFLKYAHSLPTPATGPHVAIISVQTPYEKVVERGATVTNYHAQEAEQEFLGKPLPFVVRVQVDFTATYPAYTAHGSNGSQMVLQPLPDLKNDFKIEVIQDEKIPARSTRMYLIYSDVSYSVFGASGAVIEQDYDPETIRSSEMTIKVQTPDNQEVETTFDLAQLQ